MKFLELTKTHDGRRHLILMGRKVFSSGPRIYDDVVPDGREASIAGSGGSVRKIALCWIGIGDYNCLFQEMYESFNMRFCNDLKKTFFIFTDRPELYTGVSNAEIYPIPHACQHKGFILFRKWKYLLQAEDRYLDYDYVCFINGNMVCKEIVPSSEVIDPQKPLTIITHPCDKWIHRGTHNCNPQSLASFNPTQNWQYKQAGFNISTTVEFLKMANTIEGWRHLDKATGADGYVPWHDETYANRYFYENQDKLKVLNGKIYCFPCGVSKLEKEFSACKLYTRSKSDVFKKSIVPIQQDLYWLGDGDKSNATCNGSL